MQRVMPLKGTTKRVEFIYQGFSPSRSRYWVLPTRHDGRHAIAFDWRTKETGLGLGLRQSQPVPSALQKHWKYLRCHPLNVGFVPGGSQRIVKAGSATAKIDVRISSDTEVQGINAVLAGLAAHSTPARLEVGGERNGPAKGEADALAVWIRWLYR